MIHAEAAPRGRRRSANRKRILDSAAEVVAREGVDGLSIKKVAQLADYTPGALYRYFPSKDALLAAVAADAIDTLREDILARSASKKGLEAVVVTARAYCDFASAHPSLFALLSMMFSDPRVLIADTETAKTVGGAIIQALLPLATALEASADSEALDPGNSKERALLIWSALQGTLQLRKQERIAPEFINADRLAMRMVQALLKGWGGEAALVDRLTEEEGEEQ